jgi:multiple sugar transport system ATP-binding protein
MDEPLSNLDAKLRVHTRAELKKLQKELGVTTVYVTHDQVEAMTMADRIAVMERGVLQQHDTPQLIYSHPSNTFVAGFIGSPPINLFDCSLRDGRILDAGDFTLQLTDEMTAALRGKSTGGVTIGIRPQDVVVSHTSKEGLIRSRVYTVEPMGDMAILDLKVGEQLVKAVVSPDFEAADGDELWLRFPSNKVLLFDRSTGGILT